MNTSLILMHLFAAVLACRNACARTREMVKRAIARYIDLVAA